MFGSTEFLLLLALIPGLLILFIIYTSDRIEREPIGLILKLVFFGVLSTIPAIILESIITKLIVEPLSFSQLTYAIANGFLCAALSEELVKLFFLRLGTWKRQEFNFHYDAVVYSVSVSLGFAMLENVLYVFQNGIATGVMRAICSVPLHAFCGVFMGFHYGNAKKAEITCDNALKRKSLWNAWLVPFLIHGAFDALLMHGSGLAILVFLVFLAGLYVFSIKKIRYCVANDRNFLTGTTYAPLTDWGFPKTIRVTEPVSIPVPEAPSPSEWVPLQATPARQARKTNPASIIGFLLGIVSYLTMTIFILPNLLAVIFSAIGLRKRKNGFAITGFILGVTSLLFGILIWIAV